MPLLVVRVRGTSFDGSLWRSAGRDAAATAAKVAQKRLAERDWETDELARQQREVRKFDSLATSC